MIVYNGGTYDLIHEGHLFVFEQMRQWAGSGEVVIALNTDEFVGQFKERPVVLPYVARRRILLALRDIDRVVPNVGGADSRPTIELVRPDIIAVGRDWWSEDDSKYCAQMGFDKAWLAERGIELRYLDWLEGRSSTNLRATARAMSR